LSDEAIREGYDDVECRRVLARELVPRLRSQSFGFVSAPSDEGQDLRIDGPRGMCARAIGAERVLTEMRKHGLRKDAAADIGRSQKQHGSGLRHTVIFEAKFPEVMHKGERACIFL